MTHVLKEEKSKTEDWTHACCMKLVCSSEMSNV
jgi:hypothetical protein